MKYLPWATLGFCVAPFMACAIVINPNVPDSKYLVPESVFPALAELPGEGQGTLIAPRWVVTAAHATQGYMLMRVKINGQWRSVSEVHLYPGFLAEFEKVKLAAEHPTLENYPNIEAAFTSMHDIALIELANPVEDVKAVPLYLASDEENHVIQLLGKGATGNGDTGQYPNSPHRGQLRQAENRITKADGQWLDYRFDCHTGSLPLEGVIGDGDSGGPVLIRSTKGWALAGVSDWKHWPEGHSQFVAGVCNQVYSSSRISYYAPWIKKVISAK